VTLCMTASDPLFPEWNFLLTLYAQMLNPACFVNLLSVDVNSVEYKADVEVWRQQVADKWDETKRLKWWAERLTR